MHPRERGQRPDGIRWSLPPNLAGRPNAVTGEITAVEADEAAGRYAFVVNVPLPAAGRLKGSIAVVTHGDGTTHVVFDLEVDLKIKIPGMIVKKAQKGIADTATKGLRKEVLRRYS